MTEVAQRVWKDVVRQGDTAVDATCGNGRDSLSLARLAGPTGRLLAFDIQADAIAATQLSFEQELHYTFTPQGANVLEGTTSDGPLVKLILESHERCDAFVEGSVKAMCFNLGYLPGGRKEITTQGLTTVKAIERALSFLDEKGVMTVMMYCGHEEGRVESELIRSFCCDLSPQEWLVTHIETVNRKLAPSLLIVRKV